MKWILVKDAVPQDDGEVLTYHSGDGVSGPYYCVDWYNARRETFVEAHNQQGEVVAWAEIPEPPSEMVELTKTPTNTQSAAVAQIADDMAEWVIRHRNQLETPWYNAVCRIQSWCRQLRAL